jgi:hypothetical protein
MSWVEFPVLKIMLKVDWEKEWDIRDGVRIERGLGQESMEGGYKDDHAHTINPMSSRTGNAQRMK